MSRALVLSGGGCKGAFQVGALGYLTKFLDKEYKIFCGVSVGAINCAFLSQFTDMHEAATMLEKLWLELDTSKVYKRWCPFGKLHALWKKSVYNSKPLKKMIRKKLNQKKIVLSGNKLRVGAVCLDTGEYRVFDETCPYFHKAVIASSAFPAMLTPAKIGQELWIDGGIRDVTPLKSAIDLGATEIDVIITAPSGVKQNFPKDPDTIDIAMRSIDVMSDEIMVNDIQIAEFINEQVRQLRVDKREVKINLIQPQKHLTDDPLDFSPELIRGMIRQGFTDAYNSMENK
jgi:NTE family protein